MKILIFNFSNLNFTDWAIVVILRICRNQGHFVDFWAPAGTNLVKNVKASLSWQLENDARFFEEVGVDIPWGQFSRDSEMDPDEFSETGWVVVSGCFSITKSLKLLVFYFTYSSEYVIDIMYYNSHYKINGLFTSIAGLAATIWSSRVPPP